jgi:uncharacterized protein YqhQ
MMRSPQRWALAVRQPGGGIYLESHPVRDRRALADVPLMRGVTALVDTLGTGIRALAISARIALGETPDAAPPTREVAGALALGAVVFTALFILLPAILPGGGPRHGGEALVRNLIEGGIRIAILLAYVVGISFIRDIRRVFEYHGAEHKVIAAREAGAPATVEAARPFPKVHVRCGTDFLFLVMIVAIFVFSLLGRPPLAWRLASRVLLTPVVAAISYEVLRLAARYEQNPVIRALTFPGRALQLITTREPGDDQIEVALASLDELLRPAGT